MPVLKAAEGRTARGPSPTDAAHARRQVRPKKREGGERGAVAAHDMVLLDYWME